MNMLRAILHFLVPVAEAAPPPPSCDFISGGFSLPAGGMFICFADFLSGFTFATIGLAASISLIMLMINGFRYMLGPATPGGSSDAAKKGITSALTGLAVSLLTYLILDTFVNAVTQ